MAFCATIALSDVLVRCGGCPSRRIPHFKTPLPSAIRFDATPEGVPDLNPNVHHQAKIVRWFHRSRR
jgi:hypothetical protein